MQGKEKIALTAINRKISDIPTTYCPRNFITKSNDGKAYIEIDTQYETWYGMKTKNPSICTFIHPGKILNGISNMLSNLPITLIKLIIDLWAPCLRYCQEEFWGSGSRHWIICDKPFNECANCCYDLDEKSLIESCTHKRCDLLWLKSL